MGKGLEIYVLRRIVISGFMISMLCYLSPCRGGEGRPSEIPVNVLLVLELSGKYRQQFVGVIDHYSQHGDSLKLEAAYFLIGNLDTHYSSDYLWMDENNMPVHFDELMFSDFQTAIGCFDSISKTKKLHPVYYDISDLELLSAEFLIDNIDLAFEVWDRPWNENLSFEDFCEYILPYRVDNELIQPWRGTYKKKFDWILDSIKNDGVPCEAAKVLNSDLNTWYVNSFQYENGNNRLPLQGPLMLLFRKQGDCPNMTNLACYAFRSVGIPARVDFSPFWPTSSGRHFWNVTLDHHGNPIMFMGTQVNPGSYHIPRELGKVYRRTFAKQKQALASIAKPEEIPAGFMLSANIEDVTREYEEVVDLEIQLQDVPGKVGYVFLAVFNNQSWCPVSWAKIDKKTNTALFSDMGKGVVYLPVFYVEKEVKPAGDPIKVPHSEEAEKISYSIDSKSRLTIPERAKYLIYRPGKEYALYVWDTKWREIGKKKAVGESMTFDGILGRGLFTLVPEYSSGKERIFTLNNQGDIEYW